MSVSAIGAVGAASPALTALTGVAPTTAVTAAGSTAGTAATSGAGFANVLSGVDRLQQLQATAQDLSVKAVTGDLTDVQDYTIAASEASLATELTAAVRNKAVDAFNEIMRMQA